LASRAGGSGGGTGTAVARREAGRLKPWDSPAPRLKLERLRQAMLSG
jgi:hypothetical protein